MAAAAAATARIHMYPIYNVIQALIDRSQSLFVVFFLFSKYCAFFEHFSFGVPCTVAIVVLVLYKSFFSHPSDNNLEPTTNDKRDNIDG